MLIFFNFLYQSGALLEAEFSLGGLNKEIE